MIVSSSHRHNFDIPLHPNISRNRSLFEVSAMLNRELHDCRIPIGIRTFNPNRLTSITINTVTKSNSIVLDRIGFGKIQKHIHVLRNLQSDVLNHETHLHLRIMTSNEITGNIYIQTKFKIKKKKRPLFGVSFFLY